MYVSLNYKIKFVKLSRSRSTYIKGHIGADSIILQATTTNHTRRLYL